MAKLIHVLVVILAALTNYKSKCESVIVGLQKRLEEFQICNIRITAEFDEIDFEPFPMPLALMDPATRKSARLFLNVLISPIHEATRGFMFKYRESICMIDLIIHLEDEPYGGELVYWHKRIHQQHEYMNDKYLVIIRHSAAFLA